MTGPAVISQGDLFDPPATSDRRLMRRPAIERVMGRVVYSDTPFAGTPCWIYTGCLNHAGYGTARDDAGGTSLTHRITYAAAVGPVPDGLQIDHLCRVRSCCNPSHMEPVTASTNTLRGNAPAAVNARKSTCQNGHPLTGDNLSIEKGGRRRCRACKADYNHRYHRQAVAS